MTDGALLAYFNRCLGRGTFTGTVGAWPGTPPIAHLGWEQVPVPFALVTPAAGVAEFTFQALDAGDVAEAFSLDTLALLAHTAADDLEYRPGLPAGALVRFLDGATELASIEWQPVPNRNLPANVYAVLSQAVTLDTLTVRIEQAGSAQIRIGGLWAGPSIRFKADRGLPTQPEDFSRVPRVDATRWPNRRTVGRVSQVNASRILADQATGSAGGVNFEGIFEDIGSSSPVIYIHRGDSQANIERTAIYGYLSSPRVTHRSGPVHAVQFGVEEMR